MASEGANLPQAAIEGNGDDSDTTRVEVVGGKSTRRAWYAWSLSEEREFFTALKELGKDFARIAQQLGSKSTQQVRYYFYRALKRLKELLGPDFAVRLSGSAEACEALLAWWELQQENRCTEFSNRKRFAHQRQLVNRLAQQLNERPKQFFNADVPIKENAPRLAEANAHAVGRHLKTVTPEKDLQSTERDSKIAALNVGLKSAETHSETLIRHAGLQNTEAYSVTVIAEAGLQSTKKFTNSVVLGTETHSKTMVGGTETHLKTVVLETETQSKVSILDNVTPLLADELKSVKGGSQDSIDMREELEKSIRDVTFPSAGDRPVCGNRARVRKRVLPSLPPSSLLDAHRDKKKKTQVPLCLEPSAVNPVVEDKPKGVPEPQPFGVDESWDGGLGTMIESLSSGRHPGLESILSDPLFSFSKPPEVQCKHKEGLRTAVASKLTLQLFPKDEYTLHSLQKDGYNPHYQLSLKASKSVAVVVERLSEKWKKSSVAKGQQVRLHPCRGDILDDQVSWGNESVTTTVGDIWTALGGVVLRLRYGWPAPPDPSLISVSLPVSESPREHKCSASPSSGTSTPDRPQNDTNFLSNMAQTSCDGQTGIVEASKQPSKFRAGKMVAGAGDFGSLSKSTPESVAFGLYLGGSQKEFQTSGFDRSNHSFLELSRDGFGWKPWGSEHLVGTKEACTENEARECTPEGPEYRLPSHTPLFFGDSPRQKSPITNIWGNEDTRDGFDEGRIPFAGSCISEGNAVQKGVLDWLVSSRHSHERGGTKDSPRLFSPQYFQMRTRTSEMSRDSPCLDLFWSDSLGSIGVQLPNSI